MRRSYPANVKLIRVPCTGRVDDVHLMKAFEQGMDGVFVAGCLEGECHYLRGNLRAKKRVEHVKGILTALGINPERLQMYNLSAAMGGRFVEIAQEMTEKVKALGPSPVNTGQGREPIEAHEEEENKQ
jgi:F420-non-reducing hydrogenase iron-sulfur subunit